ncbi:7-dimethylallyltryptophan synthase-like protein [Hapsidospora chrysogenum ATCC 11550]|uniref:7-dimethylallyltryptophan synthase-like protein n=1 Tax=Hapsidospora chrysogenum (strain ATCC 11550 / CBS 779.69 / DSM 880 / IAM 14645 / JCM 23072 / IMI 49137) TaxID=857340 RepID=A0A086SW64_HAPC1|nr:7-dimethylallyltryptophan synthase-like protein [Hapsidospora chrysogenum ATCC 11550]
MEPLQAESAPPPTPIADSNGSVPKQHGDLEPRGGVNDEDVVFWTKHTLHVLSALLRNSGAYTQDQQASHLDFFRDVIIPNLGPRPTQPNHKYELVTHNGSPVEFSLNFSGASEHPAVRFSYEPKGSADHVSKPLGAYMGWSEQLRAEFGPSAEDRRILATALPHLPQIPEQLLAVDFKTDGRRAMKSYIGPGIKQMTTGIDPNRASIDAIKRLEPGGEGFGPALDLFEEYRATCANPPTITMLGVDCIEPLAGARIKIYTRTESSASDSIRDQVTLGGRRSDETTTHGVRILRDIWSLLLNEKDDGNMDDSWAKPERNSPSMHSGLMISWELQLGKQVPEPKVYVPLWQFCDSNRQITANLEEVFKKWGWSWGTDHKYSAAVQDAL